MPARSRRRYPLAFGQGLDRETGVMEVNPASFEDIRNVYLEGARATIRGGFTTAFTISEADTIVAGRALKSERVGIFVGYRASDETVHVFRSAADGSSYEYVGEWVHDQGGWGSEAPKVQMAESYGRVFMAHDISTITDRAKTIYYDPIFSGGTLEDLTADMDGNGVANIRYRGVVRHYNFLFGWGFGSASENRPELLRVSKPGEPTLFEPNSYFIVGDRRDPVLLCRPAGRSLLAFKETETYGIFGANKRDFAEEVVDPLYGLAGTQLAVNYSGNVIGWSGDGPRVWPGPSPSDDLELPLDLDGWEPTDLVAEGEVEDAFAHYVPSKRIVLFVFGQRVYALSVREPGNWRWAYWELGFTPSCAFTFFPGAEVAEAPTGHPEYDSANTEPAGTYCDVAVDNVGQDGDEVLEIWLSEDGGAWFLGRSLAVATTADQEVRVPASTAPAEDDLTPGSTYDVALRYRRGTLYGTGYEDTDSPQLWPSVSRGQFTTLIDPPTIDSAVWSRTDATTEGITLTITPAPGQEGNDIEIRRDGALIHTETAPAGQFTFEDTGIAGETLEEYDVRTIGGAANSPWSDVTEVWAGPQSPPTIEWVQEYTIDGNPSYAVGYIPGDETLETELWDSYDTATDTETGNIDEDFRTTNPASSGLTQIDPGSITGGSSPVNVTMSVSIRHKSTVDGVDDFSRFAIQNGVFLCKNEGTCS